MNCAAVVNVIDLYLESRLSPGRTDEVAAHRDGCAACRAMGSPVLPVAPVAHPDLAALRRRIETAMRAEPESSQPERAPAFTEGWAPAAALAAAYAVLMLALHAIPVPATEAYAGGGPAAVEAVFFR